MNSKKAILILIIVLAFEPVLWAGNGTSAADFLNIGISARTAGTGEAMSALSDGPISSYYNPAGLAGIYGFQIAGLHSEWFQDMRYEYLGMACPIGGNGAMSISASYLGFGDIKGYSVSNEPTGNLNASDWSLGLSYGRGITTEISLGTGIKIIGEKLMERTAYGVAGDIGVQYRAETYEAGLAILNLGPNIKYELASSPLPTKIDAGFSFYPMGKDLGLLAGLSVPFHGNASLRTGLEYTYAGLLMLRSGYNSGRRMEGQGGFSFGAGFNISNNSLDYAYNVNSILGGTHQLSFTLRFGRSGNTLSYSQAPLTPHESGAVGSDPKKKMFYLVCAARYSSRADAEKHIESLKLFGYSSKIQVKNQNTFLVVLGKSDQRQVAEKIKSDFGKGGLTSFIEEE